MAYSANGYLKETLTFSDSGLTLLQTACVKAIIPVATGRLKLIFTDNSAFDVKALLKSYKGVKVNTLTVKLYVGSTLKNTYTYNNIELVPVDSQVSNLNNTVVNYTVEVVAESHTSTYDWKLPMNITILIVGILLYFVFCSITINGDGDNFATFRTKLNWFHYLIILPYMIVMMVLIYLFFWVEECLGKQRGNKNVSKD